VSKQQLRTVQKYALPSSFSPLIDSTALKCSLGILTQLLYFK